MKITGKVAAATLCVTNAEPLRAAAGYRGHLLSAAGVGEGSVTLEYEGGNVLVSPGSAV